ncbi:TM0106 family RecB-like putative nuclease [Gordonia sp. VNK21]|uniref:TM0106 family RecB-like putative nuclease n=1 Tax=Gordonia sp. VNK21 TaxID=3382483 RepID=UPI0038D4A4FC
MDSAVLGARNLSGCEHRLALDFNRREQAVPVEQTTEAQRRIEAAQIHRNEVISMLRGLQSADPASYTEIDDDAPLRERVAATLAACRAGVPWIFQAWLPSDPEHGRRGHAEVLLRHGTGYLPIIIVNHRVTSPAKGERDADAPPPSLRTSPLWGWTPEPDATRTARSNRRDALRLTHLASMLDELGLSAFPDRADWQGGVIGSDADCIVAVGLGSLLADYDELLVRRRAVAEGRIATHPRKVSECRSCAWWPECEVTLYQERDLSLVIGGSAGEALRAAGIVTFDELADYRGEPPEDWPGSARLTDAVVSANCLRDGIPLVRRLERPRVARADIEVDVDMESFGERGAYLWGTLLTDTTDPAVPVRYRPFVTWDPLPTDDEARSFAEFWGWMKDRRAEAAAQGKTFAAYCYSQQAENRWLRGSADRFAGYPGIPSREEVDAFIASPQWVDIYEAVGANFICPNGKGLKRIAPVAGFHWRDDEASGEASMDWYAAAVALDGTTLDVSQRDRLLEYNEDDVQATKVLREWLSSADILRLPTAEQVLS